MILDRQIIIGVVKRVGRDKSAYTTFNVVRMSEWEEGGGRLQNREYIYHVNFEFNSFHYQQNIVQYSYLPK